MSRADRAKQFIPFDALKGFREAILEKEKNIIPKKILSEDIQEEINLTLTQITIGCNIAITYYDGESYTTITDQVKKISVPYHTIELTDISIAFNDILDITIMT